MKKILVFAGVLALVWAAAGVASISKSKLKPVATTGDESIALKKSQGPLAKPFLISPGYGVGTTDFDWLRNGSMGKSVVRDDQPIGVHVYWTYRTGGDPANRRGYYNFKDENGTWLGGLAVEGRVTRMGSLTTLADGRGVPTSHFGGNPNTTVSVDAVRGAGAFIGPYDVDPTNPVYPIWPIIARGGSDVLHVNSVTNGQPNHWYSRSTDEGQTWTPWFQLCNDGLGGGWNTLTAQGSKVGWVYPDINYQLYYRESPDAGSTWGAKTLIDPGDTTNSRLFQDALYGPTGELHVVWDVVDTQASTPVGASQIRHWSPSTGISVVRSAYWTSASGSNINSVGCPSIGYNSRNNTWWCTWVEFTLEDTSAGGWSNGEVWAAFSNDNGATWRGARNLTNSPTPGAPPGACADDRYQSLAAVVDDTLRVLYLSSFDAGSAQYEGSAVTTDTIRYFQTYATGVEEAGKTAPTPASFELGASRPNPLSKTTAITYSLPVGGEVNLAVYNAAGQLVKTLASGHRAAGAHTTRWNASSVPAGVYFYRLTAGTFTQTRSMVVVR